MAANATLNQSENPSEGARNSVGHLNEENKAASSGTPKAAPPRFDPIIAEFDLDEQKLSEGRGSLKKVRRRRKQHESGRGHKSRSQSSQAKANSEEGSSCTIF